MALLNPPRSLPGLMRAIITYLMAVPGNTEELKRIQAMFAPSTLSGKADGGSDGSPGLDDTLEVGRSIGLLTRGVSPVALSEGAQRVMKHSDGSDTAYRKSIRRFILDAVRDGDPWVFNNKGEPDSTGCRDFARASTWVLSRSPIDAPLAWDAADVKSDVERSQHGLPAAIPQPFENDTRWNAFRRWAPSIGLARMVSRGTRTYLLPDATMAIAEELIPLLSPRQQPITTVLARLGEALPPIQYGAYRKALDKRLDRQPIEREILDTVVAQAVLGLEDSAVITLDFRDDAQGVVVIAIDPQSQPRLCSHIRIGEKAKSGK